MLVLELFVVPPAAEQARRHAENEEAKEDHQGKPDVDPPTGRVRVLRIEAADVVAVIDEGGPVVEALGILPREPAVFILLVEGAPWEAHGAPWDNHRLHRRPWIP